MLSASRTQVRDGPAGRWHKRRASVSIFSAPRVPAAPHSVATWPLRSTYTFLTPTISTGRKQSPPSSSAGCRSIARFRWNRACVTATLTCSRADMSSWKERAPPEFTLVVFVRTPKQRRYTRLLARERERYGDRVAPGGDLHAISSAFLAWCAAYDDGEQPGRSLPRHLAYYGALPGPKLTFVNQRPFAEEAARLLASVTAARGQATG